MLLKAQTSVPLAANGQWISGWIDGEASGTLASAVYTSDAPGTMIIQQTDDPNVLQFTTNAAATQAIGGSPNGTLMASITRRFWRVIFYNMAIAQTTFTMTVTGSASVEAALLWELQKMNFQLTSMRSIGDTPTNDVQQFLT